MRRLLVGLGNPGAGYARTRHNIGFMCIEELGGRHGLAFSRSRHQAEVATGLIHGQQVVLALPQTYMNNSGIAVASLVRFYRISLSDTIVVYDDLDLSFGTLRLRGSGSAGGHRGMESIVSQLGDTNIARLRVGIGRPPGRMPAERYVLAPFSATEMEFLPEIRAAAAAALETWLMDGLALAMGRFNGWSPGSPMSGHGSPARPERPA